MRTLRLARIAVEAEGLRLRKQARRMAIRLAVLWVAFAFLLAALAFGHVAMWFGLRWGANMAPWATALVVSGVDLAIALVLVLIAAFSRPDRVEQEALRVRQQALEQATGRLALAELLVPILQVAIRLMRK